MSRQWIRKLIQLIFNRFADCRFVRHRNTRLNSPAGAFDNPVGRVSQEFIDSVEKEKA